MNAVRPSTAAFVLLLLLVVAVSAPGARQYLPPSSPAAETTAPPPAANGPTVDPLDTADPLPRELAGMNIVEHLDAQIPPDLEFKDQAGRSVRLGDYFDGQRPVVLVLNYNRCPMLCGIILNELLRSMQELDWTAGEQFRVVSLSFDPLETPELANVKRQNYLREYGRPAADIGWDFLVGRQAPIQTVLDTTGFPVRWSDRSKQYIHPACLIILTPEGRISRYLYGIYYESRTLKLSLLEAAQGKVGSTIDRILLFCYHYDASEGRYSVAAMNLVRAGGVLTMLLIGIMLLTFWRRERHNSRPGTPAARPRAPDPNSL